MKKKTVYKKSNSKKFSLKRKPQGPNRALQQKMLAQTLFKKSIKTLRIAFISIIAMGTLAAAVDGGYRYYKSNDVLILKDVVCQGNEQLTSEEIRQIMQLELGVKLFAVTLSESEAALKKNAWIKDVKLRRQFPSSLKVDVEEYVPLALLYNQQPDSKEPWRGLSEKGRLLTEITPQKFDLPILENNIHVDERTLTLISDFLSTAKSEYPSFYNSISQIRCTNSMDLSLVSRENNFRILITLSEDFKSTIEMWSLLISQYRNDFTQDQTIDLRIPGKAYVS